MTTPIKPSEPTARACYSPRMDEALAFAAQAFRHRRRKGSDTPYLCHLLQVATWVGEWGGDEDQIIAGLLHDYLEDIEGGSEAELAGHFGRRVSGLVAALSDTMVRPKPPWRERKERYLAQLRGEPAEVKLVSACDKLHNARSILRDLAVIGDALWSRFTASKDETLWYYETASEALADGWPHPLTDELFEAVQRMQAMAAQR